MSASWVLLRCYLSATEIAGSQILAKHGVNQRLEPIAKKFKPILEVLYTINIIFAFMNSKISPDRKAIQLFIMQIYIIS